MGPGTELASHFLWRRFRGVPQVMGRKAELRLLRYPLESANVKVELGALTYSQQTDYTDDVGVGKSETLRINSRESPDFINSLAKNRHCTQNGQAKGVLRVNACSR
jgi:hypothetical protein